MAILFIPLRHFSGSGCGRDCGHTENIFHRRFFVCFTGVIFSLPTFLATISTFSWFYALAQQHLCAWMAFRKYMFYKYNSLREMYMHTGQKFICTLFFSLFFVRLFIFWKWLPLCFNSRHYSWHSTWLPHDDQVVFTLCAIHISDISAISLLEIERHFHLIGR